MSRALGAALIVTLLAFAALMLFPSLPDPTCASVMVRTATKPRITIPANCVASRSVVPDAMVSYLEQERIRRGLLPDGWITCTERPAEPFSFTDDPHWLPSYVPGAYQFRRTVIIVPYVPSAPKGSPWWLKLA
jgi:hypothetical protein